MKKRVICLIAVLCMLVPTVLTGCGGDGKAAQTGKALVTLSLYGITGDTTTPEAIKLVQDEINQYTEGNLSTHIELHLFPEDEYYAKLDERFAEQDAEFERQDEAKRNDRNYKAPVEYMEGSSYKKEHAGQIDIFMVQGATNLHKYYNANRLSNLTKSLSKADGGIAKILNSYISMDMFTTVTIGGRVANNGYIEKGQIVGVPNNSVSGDYTYLLVNKELATKYYYSAEDVDTLEELGYFLDDVKKNHNDYIPLYNKPELFANRLPGSSEYIIGSLVSTKTTWSSISKPKTIFEPASTANYYNTMYNFKKEGYITEGDYYAGLPEGQKVAAAFLKGNAALPENYEDDYFVITYQKPVADPTERPGTVFCVNSGRTTEVDRCMEVITALQTVASFRNTFQYGVEDAHYSVDEFTGMINILNDDYSMDARNTGNLFLLTPNNRMDKATLALAENNWELAKQQYRDTVTGPYCMFPVTTNTEELFANLRSLDSEITSLIENFTEYTDEEGKLIDMKEYIKKVIKPMFAADENVKAITEGALASEYTAWFNEATQRVKS